MIDVFRAAKKIFKRIKQSVLDSVVDRHHFAADPELGPTFHCDSDTGKGPGPDLDLDLHIFRFFLLILKAVYLFRHRHMYNKFQYFGQYTVRY
jgi:hypothetical protein